MPASFLPAAAAVSLPHCPHRETVCVCARYQLHHLMWQRSDESADAEPCPACEPHLPYTSADNTTQQLLPRPVSQQRPSLVTEGRPKAVSKPLPASSGSYCGVTPQTRTSLFIRPAAHRREAAVTSALKTSIRAAEQRGEFTERGPAGADRGVIRSPRILLAQALTQDTSVPFIPHVLGLSY